VRLADGTGGLEQSVRGLLRFEWQTRRSQKWCQPKSHRKRVKAVWFSIGEEFGQPTPNGEPFLGSKIPCRPVVPSSVPSCSTASLRFRYCSGLQLPGVSPPGKGILRDPQFSQQPIRPRPVNRLLRRFQIVGKTAPNIILQADVRLDQSSPDRVQVNVMAYRVQTISSRDSVLPDTQLTAASP
jgi:hypothetical protein